MKNIAKNSKKLWSFVNDKIDKKSIKKPITQIQSEEKNKIIHDLYDISNNFNRFFCQLRSQNGKCYQQRTYVKHKC